MTSQSLSKTTHSSIGGQEYWFEYSCRNYRIFSIRGQEDWFHFFRRNYSKCLQLTIEMAYASFMLPERCILEQLWYFYASIEVMIFYASRGMHFYVSSYASKSWSITIILRLSQKAIFQYVNPFTMKPYVDINTRISLYIQNTNKRITTKYEHTARQETSGDIHCTSCWKGRGEFSYTSSTYYKRNWIPETKN